MAVMIGEVSAYTYNQHQHKGGTAMKKIILLDIMNKITIVRHKVPPLKNQITAGLDMQYLFLHDDTYTYILP